MDDLEARLARLTPSELAEVDRLLLSEEIDFKDWLPLVSPTYHWDWPHLRLIQDHLQSLYRGDIENLMVLCPPRHGKSEQNTIRFPVYWLEHRPQDPVIVACYAQTLAARFTRKSRSLARQRGIPLNEERKAADDWHTLKGGGVRGAGVGTGIAGTGAKLLVIDDPVKDRQDAESEVVRESSWQWVNDDLLSRREPKCRSLWTYTPWHMDDPGQRLLNSEEGKYWTVLRLPAFAEEHDPLGRKEGEALCPERYPVEALTRIKERMTPYSFSALFQCNPIVRDGSMFPRDKVQIVDEVPTGMPWVRFWDYAGTEGGGAYTAGTKLGIHKGLVYVLDVQRFQKAALERDNHVLTTASLDKSAGGIGSQWLEQEPGSAGKDAAARFVRMLQGHNAHHETATGDKIVRAEQSGWAATWQAGNVRLLRGGWNEAYIREHEAFGPGSKYKDQVDSSVGAYTKAVKRPTLAAPLLDLVKESHWA